MIRITLTLTFLCAAILAPQSNADEPSNALPAGPAVPVLTTPRTAPCCGQALAAQRSAGKADKTNDHQRFKDFVANHRCEPEGCPKPLGCSNPWTEFKFVFGSCTQFFGSAEATRGCLHKTTVPPPYRIPYPQQP
jgi:hypothetical protein